MWAALGNLAWQTAAYTGVVTDTTAQPPLGCAWPLREPTTLAEFLAENEKDFQDMAALAKAGDWELLSYKDPEAAEGGDLHLFSRPQIGAYHFLKATFSLQKASPEKVRALIGSPNVEERKRFSADILALQLVEKLSETCQLDYLQYWAPPPVAARDFCFLVGTKKLEDGSIVIWGCSVANAKCPDTEHVRGSSEWMWHLIPVGEHTLVTYISVMDPRGWTPSFLISWLKTTAANEFVAIRAVMAGKQAHVKQESLAEAGISEEDIKKESEARPAAASS